MSGAIALVGSGEFTPAMVEVDRGLLAATGRHRARVVILPTASWPDGEAVFLRWAAMGVEHFEGLGAEVEVVLVRERKDAEVAGPAVRSARRRAVRRRRRRRAVGGAGLCGHALLHSGVRVTGSDFPQS